MSLIGNKINLSVVNNLHAIPGRAEITEKLETTDLCAFQKDKFCLLLTNKYRQNNSLNFLSFQELKSASMHVKLTFTAKLSYTGSCCFSGS